MTECSKLVSADHKQEIQQEQDKGGKTVRWHNVSLRVCYCVKMVEVKEKRKQWRNRMRLRSVCVLLHVFVCWGC